MFIQTQQIIFQHTDTQFLNAFLDKILKLLTYHILFPINRHKLIISKKQSGFLAHPVHSAGG